MQRIIKECLVAYVTIIIMVLVSVVSVFAIEPSELTVGPVKDAWGNEVLVQLDPATSEWKTYHSDGHWTDYYGIASNDKGVWYCQNGKVDFSYNGFYSFWGADWYVENGQVRVDYTGIVPQGSQSYQVEQGKVIGEVTTAQATPASDSSSPTSSLQSDDWLLLLLVCGAIVLLVCFLSKKKKKPAPSVSSTTHSSFSSPKPSPSNSDPNRSESSYTELEDDQEFEMLPYRRKKLLTNNELIFYKVLKPIADDLGLSVLAKVRMGDLVEPLPNRNRSEWLTQWGRVKSRHVDFVLVRPSDMHVRLLIELDDSSHNSEYAQAIDEFKNNVYLSTNYVLLRCTSTYKLEDTIREVLNMPVESR